MASGTTVAQSHRLPCTAEEVRRVACLHGGTCFAWDSGGGTRAIGCSCTSEWTGNRCEYMYIEPDDYSVSEASQTLALAIVLPLLLTFVIVAVLLFFYIRRRRNDTNKKRLQKSTSVSENHYESKTAASVSHYETKTAVSVSHYETKTAASVSHYETKTAVSPQNGQPRMRYDSPDMTASTQMSALSDSQRYSCNGNQTIPAVFWESAV